MALLKPDGTPYEFEGHLGNGTNSIVFQRGPYALKVPKIRDLAGLSGEELADTQYLNSMNRKILDREKAVYRRIGTCEAIAECVQISDEGILLPCFSQGDLESYIRERKEVAQPRKVTWILSAIKAVHHLHHTAKVLVFDIAPRNFLLTDDMSLKMIDFGQAALFPLDTDITTASDDGLTVQVDIFHLGCTIYSIASWKLYECNLMDYNYKLPRLEDLPNVDDCFCGEIIKNAG
ncbi:hypothetical protein VTN31DRAFT_1335 [Thermomyces dupontii]|uniref:uncharacterized protein n=1 Tax=Talaromyces thermophilus TaxID=28565 RepID=UPI003743A41F